MNFLGLFRHTESASSTTAAAKNIRANGVISPDSSPSLSTASNPTTSSTVSKSPTKVNQTTATVESSTIAAETKSTSRWWGENRFSNARNHFVKRRIGSEPSSSVRVETGTAGGNVSRNHTPSNSVTSITLPDNMAGEGLSELSTKLVEAVEKQADLEDTLAVTRHELEVANQKLRQLEEAQKEYADMMEKGMLIEKKEVENETTELTRRLLEESKHRVQAENDKNKIEQELEMLTARLFEEANNLVASARREAKNLEKRNDQLQSRLEDTETLLQSQQDQLVELKAVMQRMQEQDHHSLPTTPNLAGKPSRESLSRMMELSPLHITTTHLETEPGLDSAKSEASPFPLLIRPQYRYDTPGFMDFRSFARIARQNNHQRQTSGSYASTMASPPTAYIMAGAFPPNISKDSPPPTSRSPSITSSYSPTTERLPLKEWRFVKRAITEDIDPTLRLDVAPGLSWIARRSVQSAILDGTLVIEPTPANSIMLTYACTLCGEKRDGKAYARTHRFCTSENPSNQRYPLCQYCLERMRVTCDFTGFLRAVRDAIWKVDGQEGEEKAWDESVRLRERMFWARMGTQSWVTAPANNGRSAALEERTSTETPESEIDPKAVDQKTVEENPVTPEMQIIKTFEQMEIHNEEVAKAQTPRSSRSDAESDHVESGKSTPEFVDAEEKITNEEKKPVEVEVKQEK